MKRLRGNASPVLLPSQPVLVTVPDAEHEAANIITISTAVLIDYSPHYLGVRVRPSRYSYELLERSREFVINVPTADLVEKVDRCGVVSGRSTDKWALTGLEPEPSAHLEAPLIKQCPLAFECRLEHQVTLPKHGLFIGRVVAIDIEEAVLDKRGSLRVGAVDWLLYIDGEYWSVGGKLGSYGYSKRHLPKPDAASPGPRAAATRS